MKTLKPLREIRYQVPRVKINRKGQVNIKIQQVLEDRQFFYPRLGEQYISKKNIPKIGTQHNMYKRRTNTVS